MGDHVAVESSSRAAGSRGRRRTRRETAAERQKAERRAKAFCHRAAVNGVESGVPEEGDWVAFEWKMDEGELFHECLATGRGGKAIILPDFEPGRLFSGTKRPRRG